MKRPTRRPTIPAATGSARAPTPTSGRTLAPVELARVAGGLSTVEYIIILC